MISATGLAAGLSLLASTVSASTGSVHVPQLPDSVHNVSAPAHPAPAPGFVTTKDGHFYLNGELADFRTMDAPNLMGSTQPTENIDTFLTFRGFGTPFTRTYILVSVQNNQFPGGEVWASESMIYSWNSTIDDWNYNEGYLVWVDQMLAQAATYGVKIIIPLVNQDYGEANDWFGTFTDLIRHRYNISDYNEANVKVDWFQDPEMLRVFKKIITKVLTRNNTVNGRIWGYDDTILAWETGNEMNWGVYDPTNSSNTVYKRPAPANWTIPVAQHIKSLAPHTLVQDGSFARICTYTWPAECEPLENNSWPTETLESEYVDIVSWHFYNDPQIPLFKPFAEYVAKFKKAFLIGEMGFFTTPIHYSWAFANMTDPSAPVAGGMIWSMRPHAHSSGFLTHGEGDGVYSYHFPGWNRSPAPDFQRGERHISHHTYIASFEIIGKDVPPFPIPSTPVISDASNATFGPGVTWRGAAWAAKYELWAASVSAPYFQLVSDSIEDNVDEGGLFVPVDPSNAGLNLTLNVKNSPQPKVVHWKDTKWGDGSDASSSSRRLLRRSEVLTSEMEEMVQKRDNITVDQGSWYVVRGLSEGEHIPGPFSGPVFVASNATNATSS